MLAIVLALTASACYGVSNFIGPLLSRELPVTAVMVIGQSASLVASAVLVAVDGSPPPAGAPLVAAVVAGAGNALGLAAFYRSAALGPLSIVAPISSLGAALPVLVGLTRGEAVGAAQLAGIALGLSGVALVSRQREARAATDAGGEDRRAAVLYALLAAIGFGVFLAALDGAAESEPFWAVAVSRASLVALLVAGGLALGAAMTVPSRELPRVALPGLLLFAGTVSYTFATREGLLSVVSVLGSLFPVFTVALALLLLRERLSPLQAAGVTATIAGVVLISIPV